MIDLPGQGWTDLSHEIRPGMTQPDSFPDTRLDPCTRIASGDPFNSSVLKIASHVGTHIDAPRHFIPWGEPLHRLPPDRFLGQGVVLDLRSQNPEAISTSSLESCQPEVRKGDVVLLCTGWADRFGGSGYMDDFPYLTEDAAEWLAERKVKLLGLDTLGPDIVPPRQPPGFSFPVHKILLSRQVLIAENLAALVPLSGLRVFVVALPLNLYGGDGSPARVVAAPMDT